MSGAHQHRPEGDGRPGVGHDSEAGNGGNSGFEKSRRDPVQLSAPGYAGVVWLDRGGGEGRMAGLGTGRDGEARAPGISGSRETERAGCVRLGWGGGRVQWRGGSRMRNRRRTAKTPCNVLRCRSRRGEACPTRSWRRGRGSDRVQLRGRSPMRNRRRIAKTSCNVLRCRGRRCAARPARSWRPGRGNGWVQLRGESPTRNRRCTAKTPCNVLWCRRKAREWR